ncbi:MAG: glutathione ABC transporter substrate-binding protein [Bacillota bacterium]
MFKKSLFITFVLVLAIALMGAQAQAFNLSIAQGADAVTLDPHGENDQPSSRVRSQIYEPLVKMNTDLELVPGLATEWEQIDDTTWEFKLREGVMFHNGEEFTAEDAKFTLERLADPETAADGAHIVDFLESVEIVDDYTIRIHTEFQFGPMLAHLSHPVTGMLNKEAVEEAGEDYGSTVAVGTGPFEFLEWSTGSYIELTRFEDYWGENAEAENLIFKAIPENTVRAIEVETGGVDISYALDPVDVERLEGADGLYLDEFDTLSTHYIGFNVQKEPFDDVRVRKAINHAINVDDIVDYVYTGLATKASSPISDNVWGANTDLETYEYDTEKAKSLLEEAGYEDGFSTTIWTNDNPLRMQIAEMVQENLREIGVEVEIEVLEWGTYLEDTGEGEHDMFILGWVAVTGDADYGLYALFHEDSFGSTGNRSFWADDRVNELLDRGRTSGDQDERKEAYFEAQEIIRDEAPWVFLIHTSEVNALRDNISNFEPHPAGHHQLKDVVKEEE